MFSIALCSPPCGRSAPVGAWPALCHSRHVSSGPLSPETGPASSLAFRASGSPWFSHLCNGSVFIRSLLASWKQQYSLFFLTFWEREGEREVENVPGTRLSHWISMATCLLGVIVFTSEMGNRLGEAVDRVMKYSSLRENVEPCYLTSL